MEFLKKYNAKCGICLRAIKNFDDIELVVLYDSVIDFRYAVERECYNAKIKPSLSSAPKALFMFEQERSQMPQHIAANRKLNFKFEILHPITRYIILSVNNLES